MIGESLGPYRILTKLGEGGMGEVYRARDVRLDRDVALKILPASFASDPDRLMRFEREAKTLAALNHPNIAQIHGLEDAGGVRALVMEYVEGDDLSEAIAPRAGDAPRGLSLDDALAIARQIALALEAAHDASIIHRDLKPANVKVRADGTVKVLDFGLAKAMSAGSEASGSRGGASAFQNAATVTSPALTAMGVILGTAAYMAPEQARGRPVDRRADVWAFGCVLYEMLTGRRAFPGDDLTDVLAAVVRAEPDWTALAPDTPAAIRRLLRRCLTKDLNDRPRDIGIARLEIAEAMAGGSGEPAPAGPPAKARSRWPGMTAAALGGAALTAAVLWSLRPAAVDLQERRAVIPIPSTLQWIGPAGPGLALSPDGRWLAYVAAGDSESRIYVQALHEEAARPVSGTEGATNPFFSPDSRQIGFVARRHVWRSELSSTSVFDVGPIDAADRGVTWSEDGFIYSGGTAGLSRIPEAGGTRESLTTVDTARGDGAHRFPFAIPGGRFVLFNVFRGALDQARLAILDVSTREWREISDLPGTNGRVLSDGRLIYGRSGTLMMARLNAEGRGIVGTPEPVLAGVDFNNGGATHFAVANDGTLVYIASADAVSEGEATWVRRDGATEVSSLPAGRYLEAKLSPDGARVAVLTDAASSSSIGIWELNQKVWTSHLTSQAYRESITWMPDSRHLAFAYREAGVGSVGRLFRQAIDGGSPEPLADLAVQASSGSTGQYPASTTADGSLLAYWQVSAGGNGLGVLNLKDRSSRLVVKGQWFEPQLSPDGRWMAYSRDARAPDATIYVAAWPDVGSRRRELAGMSPRWSASGRELFFRRGSQLLELKFDPAAPDFSTSPRVVWEGRRPVIDFSLHPDGRILVLEARAPARPLPRVIFNWRR